MSVKVTFENNHRVSFWDLKPGEHFVFASETDRLCRRTVLAEMSGTHRYEDTGLYGHLTARKGEPFWVFRVDVEMVVRSPGFRPDPSS